MRNSTPLKRCSPSIQNFRKAFCLADEARSTHAADAPRLACLCILAKVLASSVSFLEDSKCVSPVGGCKRNPSEKERCFDCYDCHEINSGSLQRANDHHQSAAVGLVKSALEPTSGIS